MYYATTTDQDGEVFTIKRTLGELSEHFQRNLDAFGGNPNAEYIVYRGGKTSIKTFVGYYTLRNGVLRKKQPVHSLEALLGSVFTIG